MSPPAMSAVHVVSHTQCPGASLPRIEQAHRTVRVRTSLTIQVNRELVVCVKHCHDDVQMSILMCEMCK